MSFPVGPIFQNLREQALNAIPDGVKANVSHPWTLSDWRESGHYKIIECGKKQFTIECSPVDLGNCFFSEAEFLLDHIAEHRVTIWNAIFNSTWASPAWLIVTVYYWAFFSALAISRLTGKSLHYLTGDNLKILKLMSPDKCNLPGGAYEFIRHEEISVTLSKFYLRNVNSNFHESVWRHLSSIFFPLFNDYGDENASQLEYRLFACLSHDPTTEYVKWPTSLRNSINYKPGVGYKEVRGPAVLNMSKFVKRKDLMCIEDVISAYELETKMIGSLNFDNKYSEYARVLFLKAMLLTSIAEKLHSEIKERRKIDTRWDAMRTRFYRSKRPGILSERHAAL